MNIDWKRKLTSRKFWAAVTGFVSMMMLARGKDASVVQIVTATIMAGASLIAYIIGEGLADSGGTILDVTDLLSESEKAFAETEETNGE